MTLASGTACSPVNLTGTMLCSQAALPDMLTQGYGRIVNIAEHRGAARLSLRHGVRRIEARRARAHALARARRSPTAASR
jgi:NAD(P)-dependent dehydrogenase (short-subunit alcohol dehydrogenase family)